MSDLLTDLSELPDDETELRKLRNKLRISRQKERRALDRLDELEALVDAYQQARVSDLLGAIPLIETEEEAKGQAIAVVHWSDWHVGELVDRSKTNGLNEYNPEICRQRIEHLIRSTIKLVRLHRAEIGISQVLLVLGGDFITGHIHQELEQTNELAPAEEVQFSIELLSSGIESLLEHLAPVSLRIVCHRGNHARVTRRIQYKNDYETSYESLVYWTLRDRMRDDRIEWIIPKADIAYTELVPGCSVRTCHGHQITYGGGIGGLLVPANRWVIRQNATRPAILTMLGHFHTRNEMSSISVTGSPKGWCEYAMSKGFPYEPPTQSYHLFDCERKMFTSARPIFCEKG